MALTRFNGNVVPFASESTTDNRTVFGDVVQADDIDSNLNADFKKGWEIVGLNDNPTKQDFNAMGYTLGALTSYLYQMGIAEYNVLQEYKLNALCIGTDGTIYQSLVDANIGNALNDVSKWKNVTGSYVKLTGDQTIAGIKTFSSSPISSATQSTAVNALTRKDYVDGLNSTNVKLTGDQTIAGVKTFSSSPIVPTPTTDTQAANKAYVDNVAVFDINALTEKTTPVNTDNLAVQETGGLLKKVSFENLTKLNPNDPRAKTALNATGNAPIYACRAWVNFNGTGTVAIRASGNVSSITDNGTGDYTVNFATAMQDGNYASTQMSSNDGGTGTVSINRYITQTDTSIRVRVSVSNNIADVPYNTLSFFR